MATQQLPADQYDRYEPPKPTAEPAPAPAQTPTPTPDAFVPSAPAEQTSSYVPAPSTETGVGTTYKGSSYSGQSEDAILAQSQKGLISMLEEDNPYMQLARKQGAREAAARGLGDSSLRERASQGAAINSAMPLVQQAGQLASAERQTAQQATAQSAVAAMNATAQSEVQAASRRLSEMQQQYELAVQSGDAAAARQIQLDMSQEQNRLSEWQTKAQISSNELAQEKDRQLQQDMQGIDIDYKQWLEEATFKHQGILQGNQQAANTYSDFTEASQNILNNPDTTTEQKKASLETLKQALEASLAVIGATANIDLSKFLPSSVVGPMPSTTPGTGIAYDPAAELVGSGDNKHSRTVQLK